MVAVGGEKLAEDAGAQDAGLDVLAAEPPIERSPLFSAPNCFITPHQAWATRAARQRLMHVSVANLQAFAQGKPQNVVNQ